MLYTISRTMKQSSLALLLCLLLGASCGRSASDVSGVVAYQGAEQSVDIIKTLFSPPMKELVVQVFYEPGAEPYAGQTTAGVPVWNLLEDNIEELYKVRNQSVTVTVPKDLASMKAIPSQNMTTWTANQLFDLGKANCDLSILENKISICVLFVRGNYFEEQTQPNIIAVSLNGTTVIAVFKDVIKSIAGGHVLLRAFSEQATLVHEMGHAMGLVNNGLPMASAHEDASHLKHSNNSSDVMYWENEGMTDLRNYANNILNNGSNILWGPESLNDVKSYAP